LIERRPAIVPARHLSTNDNAAAAAAAPRIHGRRVPPPDRSRGKAIN